MVSNRPLSLYLNAARERGLEDQTKEINEHVFHSFMVNRAFSIHNFSVNLSSRSLSVNVTVYNCTLPKEVCYKVAVRQKPTSQPTDQAS